MSRGERPAIRKVPGSRGDPTVGVTAKLNEPIRIEGTVKRDTTSR